MARLPRLRMVIASRVIADEARHQRRQSLARRRWQRPPFRCRWRAAAAPRIEQIELLRPAWIVVSKLPLASHGLLPDSGRETLAAPKSGAFDDATPRTPPIAVASSNARNA